MHQQAVSISVRAAWSALTKIVLLLINEKPRRHDDVRPFYAATPRLFPFYETMLRGQKPKGQRIQNISVFLGIEPVRPIGIDGNDRRFAEHGFREDAAGDRPERQAMMRVTEGKP